VDGRIVCHITPERCVNARYNSSAGRWDQVLSWWCSSGQQKTPPNVRPVEPWPESIRLDLYTWASRQSESLGWRVLHGAGHCNCTVRFIWVNCTGTHTVPSGFSCLSETAIDGHIYRYMSARSVMVSFHANFYANSYIASSAGQILVRKSNVKNVCVGCDLCDANSLEANTQEKGQSIYSRTKEKEEKM